MQHLFCIVLQFYQLQINNKMSEMILHVNIRYNHAMMILSPPFTLVFDGYVLLIDLVFCVVFVLFCFLSVFWVQRFMCLWIVYSLLPIRFSLTFINICEVCHNLHQCYEKLNRIDRISFFVNFNSLIPSTFSCSQ